MYQKIKQEIKEAMRNHDTNIKDVLKMVLDKARAIMKEKNPTSVDETIPDDILIQAIQKEMKQLEQTKKILSENGKESSELYINSSEKIAILNNYLPRKMTREEVENAVHEILDGEEFISFGLMMKKVMSQLRGKADNRLIKEVVESM